MKPPIGSKWFYGTGTHVLTIVRPPDDRKDTVVWGHYDHPDMVNPYREDGCYLFTIQHLRPNPT